MVSVESLSRAYEMPTVITLPPPNGVEHHVALALLQEQPKPQPEKPPSIDSLTKLIEGIKKETEHEGVKAMLDEVLVQAQLWVNGGIKEGLRVTPEEVNEAEKFIQWFEDRFKKLDPRIAQPNTLGYMALRDSLNDLFPLISHYTHTQLISPFPYAELSRYRLEVLALLQDQRILLAVGQ